MPTSSTVTLRRNGAVCSTASRILPKPLMPDAASVLIGPAEMPLTRMPRGPEARRQVAHARPRARPSRGPWCCSWERCGQRPQISQGEERRTLALRRGAAALARAAKAVARNVVGQCGRHRATGPSRKSPAIASLRREADRMDQAVEFSARPRREAEANRAFDLGVVGHVAVEDEARAELGGEFTDHAFPKSLALVAEGELGALAVAGAGDAVGDRPIRQEAGDEEAACRRESPWNRLPRRPPMQSTLNSGFLHALSRRSCGPLTPCAVLPLFEGADTIPMFPATAIAVRSSDTQV